MTTVPPSFNLDESPIAFRSEFNHDLASFNSLSSEQLINIRPARNLQITIPVNPSPRLLTMRISPKGYSKPGTQLSAFSPNSEHIDPLEKVRKALKCSKRTTEEAITIYKHLENTKFFQQFRANNPKLHETDALLYLSQHITYEQCSAGKLVIEEGDSSTDKLYIIFTGEVNIVSKKKNNPIKDYIRFDHSQPEQISPLMKKSFNLAAKFGMQLKNSKTIHIQRGASYIDKPDKKHKEDETLTIKAIVSPHGKQQTTNFSQEAQALEGELPIPDLIKLSKVNSSPSDAIGQNETESNIKDQSKPIKASGFSSTGRTRATSQGSKPLFQALKLPAAQSNEILFEEDSENEEDTRRIITQHGYVINQLCEGDHFGDIALYKNIKRSAGALSYTSCEFITITEDLLTFVRRRFEKANTRKLNFMLDYFPGMDNLRHRNLLDAMLTVLEDTKFDATANLTVQGNKSIYFYVIVDGFCDLYVKLPQDPKYNGIQKYPDQGDHNRQDGIVVCRICPGMFVGEEILFNSTGEYDFTVKAVSPQVTVLALNRYAFIREFPETIKQSLQDLYLTKSKHYVDSGSERTKLKNVYMPLIKPPLTKKTGISPRDLTLKDKIFKFPEMSPSSDHILVPDSNTPRGLIVKSKMSLFFRTSALGSPLEPSENVLRSPGLRMSKNTSMCRIKPLSTPLLTETCNTPERRPTLPDVRLGSESELKSATSRRNMIDALSADFIKIEGCKDEKFQPVSKLSLKSIHSEEKQPLTSRILGKLKVSKKKSAKMKWDKVGFNLDLEKIRKSIHNHEEVCTPVAVDRMVIRRPPEDVEKKQPLSMRDKTDDMNINDGGTFMTTLGYFVPDSMPPVAIKRKTKRNLTETSLTQCHNTCRNTSEQIVRNSSDREALKLAEVSLEAAFFSGIYSKAKVRLNSER